MKVIIRVWEPHESSERMSFTTILEYDGFDSPEVIGHDVLIERLRYDEYDRVLHIWLAEYPARIDADPRYRLLHILHKDTAQYYPVGYTLLEADRGKGTILWTNPNPKEVQALA